MTIMDMNMMIMDSMKSSSNMDYVSAKLSEMKEVLDSFDSSSPSRSRAAESKDTK
jgi:hypothetical protein